MRSGNHSNALLVELLIVVLCFMLAATVLLQVFGAARSQSDQADRTLTAINEAQNIADTLLTTADTGAALSALGFTQTAEGWALDSDGRTVYVSLTEEEAAAGRLTTGEVRIVSGDTALITLPLSRYEEVAP